MSSRVVSPRLRRSCTDPPANVLYGQVDWNYIKFTGGGPTAGFRRGIRWLAIAAALLAVASALAPRARAQQSAVGDILFDLRDGRFYWSHVTSPDRPAVEASGHVAPAGAH